MVILLTSPSLVWYTQSILDMDKYLYNLFLTSELFFGQNLSEHNNDKQQVEPYEQ